MNKMNIFEAIDLIDDDLIREADISSETSSNRTEEEKAAISVSGVEVRSGIRWQRIAALASAFILIAVFGAAGALLYKNRPPRNIEPSEILIPPATESTSVTESKQTENTESAITNTKMAVKAEEKRQRKVQIQRPPTRLTIRQNVLIAIPMKKTKPPKLQSQTSLLKLPKREDQPNQQLPL